MKLDVKIGAILTEIQQKGKRLRQNFFLPIFSSVRMDKPDRNSHLALC